MHIAILTFDGFNELDSLIALGVLNRVKTPGWRVSLAGPSPTVTSMNGVTLHTHCDLAEACTADTVLVGSGMKTREIAADPALMSQLRLEPARQLVGAQCSGTLLLVNQDRPKLRRRPAPRSAQCGHRPLHPRHGPPYATQTSGGGRGNRRPKPLLGPAPMPGSARLAARPPDGGRGLLGADGPPGPPTSRQRSGLSPGSGRARCHQRIPGHLALTKALGQVVQQRAQQERVIGLW